MERGYYGARLMIKAQQAGLNSCCVTNTYIAKKCHVSLGFVKCYFEIGAGKGNFNWK